MSKNHHGGPGPVPPANRGHMGPAGQGTTPDELPGSTHGQAEVNPQEHDPKRRLGDFTGTGEHSRQEPGMLNDGDLHSK